MNKNSGLENTYQVIGISLFRGNTGGLNKCDKKVHFQIDIFK